MKMPSCYCDQAPRDDATGQPRFKCNVCVNAVLDEKNRLARAERCLAERLAGEFERGRRYGINEEGARILARIAEAIASWERAPRDDAAGMVCAALDVLSCCITHRGVSRDDAVKAALDRLAATKGGGEPVSDRWSHVSWASTLVSPFGVSRGEVFRLHCLLSGTYGAYGAGGDGNAGQVFLGTFSTRARAMRAVETAAKVADKECEDGGGGDSVARDRYLNVDDPRDPAPPPAADAPDDFARCRAAVARWLAQDADLRRGYVDNVAMLLHDRYGITDRATRCRAASEILDLIFGGGDSCTTDT